MVEEEKMPMSWNLSAALVLELQALLKNSNTNYINGDINKAFLYARGIKNRIVHVLTKKEREKTKNYEERILRLVRFSTIYKDKKKEDAVAAMNYAAELFIQYNELLMDLLEENGFLIERKADITKMKF